MEYWKFSRVNPNETEEVLRAINLEEYENTDKLGGCQRTGVNDKTNGVLGDKQLS
jgi:hypothetical protein